MKKSKTGVSPKEASETLKKRGYEVDPRALGEFRDHLLEIATPINDSADLADLAEISLKAYRSIRKKSVDFQRIKSFYLKNIKDHHERFHDVDRKTPDAFNDFLTRYTVTEQYGIVERFRSIYYKTKGE